ncbi:MAG: hypothetical protein KAG96_02090 [Ichthyobacteriaceae bacterium]|nr:hypothetical protein [Ichthyobacteriaceae bacterium]
MKKYIIFLLLLIGITFSCGTVTTKIPEGTPPETAELMKKHNLSVDEANAVILAFDNKTGLQNIRLDDISSAYKKNIGGRRYLVLRISGRNEMMINLD